MCVGADGDVAVKMVRYGALAVDDVVDDGRAKLESRRAGLEVGRYRSKMGRPEGLGIPRRIDEGDIGQFQGGVLDV